MDQQTQKSPKGYTMDSNNCGQANGRTKLSDGPSAGKSSWFVGRANYGKDVWIFSNPGVFLQSISREI
jgi:hypothetical protein